MEGHGLPLRAVIARVARLGVLSHLHSLDDGCVVVLLRTPFAARATLACNRQFARQLHVRIETLGGQHAW
eukprot:8165294-Pyramimonas_sp.AAC.1